MCGFYYLLEHSDAKNGTHPRGGLVEANYENFKKFPFKTAGRLFDGLWQRMDRMSKYKKYKLRQLHHRIMIELSEFDNYKEVRMLDLDFVAGYNYTVDNFYKTYKDEYKKNHNIEDDEELENIEDLEDIEDDIIYEVEETINEEETIIEIIKKATLLIQGGFMLVYMLDDFHAIFCDNTVAILIDLFCSFQ